MTGTYFDHVTERREMAFLKWQRSGYRDFAAHDEFIRWYVEAQRIVTDQQITDWNIKNFGID